jgi:hypothetical protein
MWRPNALFERTFVPFFAGIPFGSGASAKDMCELTVGLI